MGSDSTRPLLTVTSYLEMSRPCPWLNAILGSKVKTVQSFPREIPHDAESFSIILCVQSMQIPTWNLQTSLLAEGKVITFSFIPKIDFCLKEN